MIPRVTLLAALGNLDTTTGEIPIVEEEIIDDEIANVTPSEGAIA